MGGSGGEAGDGESSGGSQTAGGEGGADAGLGGEGGESGAEIVPVPGPPHFPEQAVVVDVTPVSEKDLVVVGSNLIMVEDGLPRAYWYFRLENTSLKILCGIDFEARFESEEGEAWEGEGTRVETPVWLFNGQRPCLGPGQVGAGYELFELPEPVDVETITRIEYSWSAQITPDAELSAELVVSDARVEASADAVDAWVVRGAVENTTKALASDVFVHAFPTNDAGMPLGHLSIVQQGIASGATWQFETPSFDQRFNSFELFVGYSLE